MMQRLIPTGVSYALSGLRATTVFHEEDCKGSLIYKGRATRVVNRLEKKGYIERQRSHDDGRVCLVKVTSRGNMLVISVSRNNEDRIVRIMSKIDPAMQEIIKTALRSFVQAIRVEE